MTKLKKSLTKIQTKILTKLINLNCDKTQKLKLWQNLRTKMVRKNQILTKHKKKIKKKKIPTKLKNLNWDQIQLKVWQILKTQTVTKFNSSNCEREKI